MRNKKPEVFDLNVKITGGELKDAFGSEAYLRIMPQAGSTFDGRVHGRFLEREAAHQPAFRARQLPAAVPEPTILLTFLRSERAHCLPFAPSHDISDGLAADVRQP